MLRNCAREQRLDVGALGGFGRHHQVLERDVCGQRVVHEMRAVQQQYIGGVALVPRRGPCATMLFCRLVIRSTAEA